MIGRLSTFSDDFSSDITGPIVAHFYITQYCSNGTIHGKIFTNLLYWNLSTDGLETWVFENYQACLSNDLKMTLTFYTASSILSLVFLCRKMLEYKI